MHVIPASEYATDAHAQISRVFVDGFYHWLYLFSKDKQKLSQGLQHMFVPECFYVAVIDDEIAGIAACTNGKTPCIHLQATLLRQHLGFVRGSIAYTVLYKELVKHTYPFVLEANTGSIEFVATAEQHRKKGVASGTIQHIFANTPYTQYVLEVADTNTNAVNLYTKLGFAETLRTPVKHTKHSGINFLVYMQYNKN